MTSVGLPASYIDAHAYDGAAIQHDRRDQVVPCAIQPRDLERRGAGAAGPHGELDAQTFRAPGQGPQRHLVVDEHRDGFVGFRPSAGHRLRRCIVDVHLNVAAAVAVEVAGLQDEYERLLMRASPDFQCEYGYEPVAPGAANMTMCTTFIADRFGCLSMTLEQPFKDTAGAPHDGTPVFGTVGQRWVGLAGAVGLLGRVAHGLLDRDEMAKLKNLERGMAGDIPPGFQDLTPDAVRERANGEPLPPQIVAAWGSQWRAGLAADWPSNLWRHVIEDFGGFEAEGDGLIPLQSAMMGAACYNASPVSHVEYFHHAPTVQQIREHLQALLAPR